MRLAHQYQAESALSECPQIQNMLGHFIPYLKCNPAISANFIWRLNVITVVSKLIIEVLVLLATAVSFHQFEKKTIFSWVNHSGRL